MIDANLRLEEALAITASCTPDAFPNLVRHLDPALIEEALHSTGTATVRRRRLPADRVVWLVLGMAVLRDWPVAEVARQLELALPGDDGSRTVAPSALVQARSKLGPEPLEWLFLRTGTEWAFASADEYRWRGLSLFAVDGTTQRVADSPENRRHFEGHKNGGGRGMAGYPSVRVVALMALRSHLLAAACFGPYGAGEQRYATALWDTVPDHSLVLLDRGFLQADVLIPLMTKGTERHWLTRAKSTSAFRVLERLGAGDELVEFDVSRHSHSKNPSLPSTFRARAVRYQRKGYRPQLLLTSLFDAKRYPAAELRVLYHERWEIELGIGEIKTDMLERMETIRSKSPAAVEQELWGILLAYNLVRLEMSRIAEELGVEPTRISFVASLRYFVEQWLWASTTATPGAIPKRLATMRDRVRLFVIPPRRPERAFPRAVKLKMSNYERKRPSTRIRAK
ncbi:MAG TPA: IS4 family transposase [Kofleriaceae bacterium]|nr:IS4 family transposase [Kofleriaceae bacterium]